MKVEEGFFYWDLLPQDELQTSNIEKNCILFLMEGSVYIHSEEYGEKVIKRGNMFFIAKNHRIQYKCLERCTFIVAGFDQMQSNCDKLSFESLKRFLGDITYEMKPLKIVPPVMSFVKLIEIYLQNKVGCGHIHSLKINEMFMCLRFFYSKEDLAHFFFPLLGTPDFKALLLTASNEARSVKELILMTGVKKTVFYDKFAKEFGGISPKLWLNQRITERILDVAATPEITVKEMAYTAGFASIQHLQQFCKRNMHSTPSQIIANIRMKVNDLSKL